jgi:hypothetical protein
MLAYQLSFITCMSLFLARSLQVAHLAVRVPSPPTIATPVIAVSSVCYIGLSKQQIGSSRITNYYSIVKFWPLGLRHVQIFQLLDVQF